MNVDEQISLHIILDVIDTSSERLVYWVWVDVLLTYKQCFIWGKISPFFDKEFEKFWFF
jgi:hypothetical protein